MDFLGISSLRAAYRYAVKIEQKFKKKNKWDFGSANQHHKPGKIGPNSQPKGQRKDKHSPDNQSKPQEKKHNWKSKDTDKWCEFHKLYPSTKMMSATQNNHCWPRQNTWIHNLTQTLT